MASRRQSADDGDPESGSDGGPDSTSDRNPASDGGPAADGSVASGEGPASGRPAGQHPPPPGPDGYPLVGSLLPLVGDPFSFYDDLAGYGDVVRYRVAGRTFTALLHPEHVERVLVAEHDRFERWLGADLGLNFAPEGVLFADGEQWRRQRRLMQPAFTMERIRSYADTMAGYADEATGEWTDGQAVALNREFSALTLRILSKALFDLDVDPAADDGAIPRAARVINERAGPERNLTAMLPEWVPTPANRRYRRAMAAYRTRVDDLIERRRGDVAGGRADDEVGGRPGNDAGGRDDDVAGGRADDETGGRIDDGDDADDLLSILLHAEGPDGGALSDEEVRDNLLTLTFAGHETTSLGLTYTCLLLARHDDVAARLREELDAVVGEETPGFEHVPELDYTEQVIREAMRLYPPAFILFRTATEDAVVGGYRVPEGSFVTLPQFHLHTDDRFWDAPGEFRPARWGEEDPDRPEYAYFPFGGGPRHCLGMRFAMLEMKLLVAVVAGRFGMTLLSDPDPELSAGVTLQPEEDVRVRVHRRE